MMGMRANSFGFVVASAVALALAGCAPTGAPSGNQAEIALGSGEIWRTEQKPSDDYRRCLTAALLRYDRAERSASALVDRARGDCHPEAAGWREEYLSQDTGESGRRWYEVRFAESLLTVEAELRTAVEDYRARGVPLTELAEKM